MPRTTRLQDLAKKLLLRAGVPVEHLLSRGGGEDGQESIFDKSYEQGLNLSGS
jgi:hypothetical protein